MLGKKTYGALSNIGRGAKIEHSKMSATLDEYGNISTHRQFELIERISELNQGECFNH